jgi:phosphoserine phosphatase
MPLVATLVSNPSARVLGRDLAQHAAAAVYASEIDWLDEGIACDLALPQAAEAAWADAALRVALGTAPVDVVVQDRKNRRKKILVADMDSTMIDQECIDELADEVGLKAHVAAITARAMNGEIAFEPALRERVALLKGLPAAVIGKVLDARITLAAGARELVATMRSNGARTALVSGGFTAFTGPVAARLGFDENFANTLIVNDNFLSGTVAEPILGKDAKAAALWRLADRLGLALDDALAVGDGANDLAMLELAGTGVALHAKPAVAARARFRIAHGDLTALLHLQGYRRSEFAPC